ncbi:hypothetical protein HAX54_022411 [Datura stramonium]|uniref:Uncharacterized protein n=1 Tax=Datura stramonium TaxID=4076 RepID=A0ABS8RJW0_DATST|nr:hypothetical protein [Datura stramonium]
MQTRCTWATSHAPLRQEKAASRMSSHRKDRRLAHDIALGRGLLRACYSAGTRDAACQEKAASHMPSRRKDRRLAHDVELGRGLLCACCSAGTRATAHQAWR